MRTARRTLLSAAGAAALLPSAAVKAETPDKSAELEAELASLNRLQTMIRLRGSADGAMTFAYLNAVRELVIEGDIIPFCELKAFVVARYVPVGDTFEAQVLECAYYIDPATGKPHTTFLFPGQSEPVSVPKYRTGPITVRFAQNLDEWEDVNPGNKGEATADFAPPSSVRLQRNVSAPWVDGETLFIRSNEYGRAYIDRAKPPAVFYREWILWRGNLDQILHTDAPDLPSEYSYSAISSWRPWMKMGATPGHTAENGRGKKIASIDDLPSDLKQLVAENDPDVLDNPAKALANVAKRG